VSLLARLGSSPEDFRELCDRVLGIARETLEHRGIAGSDGLPSHGARLLSLPLVVLAVRFWARDGATREAHDPLHGAEVGALMACAVRGLFENERFPRPPVLATPSRLAQHRATQWGELLRHVRETHDLLRRPLCADVLERAAVQLPGEAHARLRTAPLPQWLPSELCYCARNPEDEDDDFRVNDERLFFACYRALEAGGGAGGVCPEAAMCADLVCGGGREATTKGMGPVRDLHAALCAEVQRSAGGSLATSFEEVQAHHNPQIWRLPPQATDMPVLARGLTEELPEWDSEEASVGHAKASGSAPCM
jgi:hypothetical protein